MGQNELLTIIREWKSLKQMMEELETEITAAEDTIKNEMSARNLESLVVGIFKISWTKVMRNRFDTTAFRKSHEDIYQLFTKPTETRRFSIA